MYRLKNIFKVDTVSRRKKSWFVEKFLGKETSVSTADEPIEYVDKAYWLARVIITVIICAAFGVFCGAFFDSLYTKRFLDEKNREAESLLKLTSSYVSTYAGFRRAADNASLPVPAVFRAESAKIFNDKSHGKSRIEAKMVGLRGKEIVTPPSDEKLADQLDEMTRSQNFDEFYDVLGIGKETIMRSVFPSIASSSSCVTCHNQLQAGKLIWKQGDMMGAYVINRNIGSQLAYIQTVSMTISILVMLLSLISVLAVKQYRKLHLQTQWFKNLSNTDSLTGCLNRRALLESVANIFETSGGAGGLVMLDVDHFKKINDYYGHEVGDRVLIHISDVVRRLIRSEDLFARIGGEEFVVYLPGANKQESKEAADRICKAVESEFYSHCGITVKATVSIGLVQMINTKKPIFEDWLNAADRLLYKAKHTGRNRVCGVNLT